jgi:hypothetical protein
MVKASQHIHVLLLFKKKQGAGAVPLRPQALPPPISLSVTKSIRMTSIQTPFLLLSHITPFCRVEPILYGVL